jgi:hypothetical protein
MAVGVQQERHGFEHGGIIVDHVNAAVLETSSVGHAAHLSSGGTGLDIAAVRLATAGWSEELRP